MADGVPVTLPATSATGFKITPAQVEAAITPRTRWLMLNSPSNPSGAEYSAAELRAIGEVLLRHPHVWMMSDDIYEKIRYTDGPFPTMAKVMPELASRCLTINGISKAFAMTGWRCGWAIGPAQVIAACNALQGHATSNVTSITQKAAVAALTGPQDGVTSMLNEYRTRRDCVWEWLTADSRFECVKPRGAFYLFPYVAEALAPAGVRTTHEFAEALLQEAHVALTAGVSVAADPQFTPLGAPLIVRTTHPVDGTPMQRLVVAQDTGGAIRGPLRFDFFWGTGKAAGDLAGRQRSDVSAWLLVPKGTRPEELLR